LELTIKEVRYLMPVAFSTDGKHVAAVGNTSGSKFVRVWRLEDGKEVFAKDIKTQVSSNLLDFTPEGTRLLASFGSIVDQGTYCWDLASGELVWQNKQFSPGVWVLSANKIVSPGNDKRRVLDLNTGEPLPPDNLPEIDGESQLALTPDGK